MGPRILKRPRLLGALDFWGTRRRGVPGGIGLDRAPLSLSLSPMEAEILLRRLCERHGVDPSRGNRLLSLVRWSLKGPQASRTRILEVVERALAEESDGKPVDKHELSRAADHAILTAVAGVLHKWTPGDSFSGMG